MEPGGHSALPEGPDESRRAVIVTSVGAGVLVAGLALAVIGPVPALRWLGAAVAFVGVVVLAVPRTQPTGTGDEEALSLHGRPGVAFVWSRFAPGMTVVTFVAAAAAAGAAGLVMVAISAFASGVFFALLGVFPLATVARFLPALRTRQVLVTPDGVVVQMRGERAELPWATITAVDVARPTPQAAAMGGAITLRTLEHDVPGPARLQRRLRTLARPYGAAADIALPVAGLRHDPGALLVALEQRGGAPRPTQL